MDRKSRGRRMSILKPPKVDINEPDDVGAGAAVSNRRVSKVRFSRNFVKEFVPVTDGDHHTLWDATYEEVIEKSSTISTHSQEHNEIENKCPNQPVNSNCFYPNFKPLIPAQNDAKPKEEKSSVGVPTFITKAMEKRKTKQEIEKIEVLDPILQSTTLDESGFSNFIQPHNFIKPLPKKVKDDCKNLEAASRKKRKSYFNSTAFDEKSFNIDLNQSYISPICANRTLDPINKADVGSKSKETVQFQGNMDVTNIAGCEKKQKNKLELNTNNSAKANQKTKYFNATVEDGGMEFTHIGGDKEKTQQIEVPKSICAVSGHDAQASNLKALQSKRKTQVVEVSMDETVIVSPSGKNDCQLKPEAKFLIYQSEECEIKSRKTILFKDTNMDVTNVAESENILSHQHEPQPIDSNKGKQTSRKTIHFNATSQDGGMDFTRIGGDKENNQQFAESKLNVSESNKQASNRKTQLFNETCQDANMDFTQNLEIERKTQLFELPMEETVLVSPSGRSDNQLKPEAKFSIYQSEESEIKSRKTILFKDTNMDVTNVAGSENNLTHQLARQLTDSDKGKQTSRKTIHFNVTSQDGGMDFTRIEGDKEKTQQFEETKQTSNRKTQLFELPMEETVLGSPSGRSDNQLKPEAKFSIYQSEESEIKSRKTILFKDTNMDVTNVAGSENNLTHQLARQLADSDKGKQTSRKTIHFNVTSQDGGMDFTRIGGDNEKTQQFEVTNQPRNRKTQLFNETCQDANMDFTQNLNVEGKTQLFELPMEETVLVSPSGRSEDQLKPEAKFSIYQSEECEIKSRKTILFKDTNMDVTNVAGSENNLRHQHEREITDSNKGKQTSRKTIHFNATSQDGGMDFTRIGGDKEKTQQFDESKRNVSESSNRKTLLFNATCQDGGGMDFTRIEEDKEKTQQFEVTKQASNRKTKLFNGTCQDGNMDFTQNLEVEGKTQLFELPMEETVLVSPSGKGDYILKQEKKSPMYQLEEPEIKSRKTIVFKDTNMDVTNVAGSENNLTHQLEGQITDSDKGKQTSRKTIHFNTTLQDGGMDFTRVGGDKEKTQQFEVTKQANNRKTQLFNETCQDANMDFTHNLEVERKTQLFELPMEETVLVSPSGKSDYTLKPEKKSSMYQLEEPEIKSRKTILFKDTNMDVSQITDSDKGKQTSRKTIHFNATLQDGGMDFTRIGGDKEKTQQFEVTKQASNRKTQLFNETCQDVERKTQLFEIPMDETVLVSPVIRHSERRQIPVNVPEKVESKSRKTIHFNATTNDANMDVTNFIGNEHTLTNLVEVQPKSRNTINVNHYNEHVMDVTHIEEDRKQQNIKQSIDVKETRNHLRPTKLFSVMSPDCVHDLSENMVSEGKTELFHLPMEETMLVSPAVKINCSPKAEVKVFKSEQTEAILENVNEILVEPKITSRKTINFTVTSQDAGMDFTRMEEAEKKSQEIDNMNQTLEDSRMNLSPKMDFGTKTQLLEVPNIIVNHATKDNYKIQAQIEVGVFPLQESSIVDLDITHFIPSAMDVHEVEDKTSKKSISKLETKSSSTENCETIEKDVTIVVEGIENNPMTEMAVTETDSLLDKNIRRPVLTSRKENIDLLTNHKVMKKTKTVNSKSDDNVEKEKKYLPVTQHDYFVLDEVSETTQNVNSTRKSNKRRTIDFTDFNPESDLGIVDFVRTGNRIGHKEHTMNDNVNVLHIAADTVDLTQETPTAINEANSKTCKVNDTEVIDIVTPICERPKVIHSLHTGETVPLFNDNSLGLIDNARLCFTPDHSIPKRLRTPGSASVPRAAKRFDDKDSPLQMIKSTINSTRVAVKRSLLRTPNSGLKVEAKKQDLKETPKKESFIFLADTSPDCLLDNEPEEVKFPEECNPITRQLRYQYLEDSDDSGSDLSFDIDALRDSNSRVEQIVYEDIPEVSYAPVEESYKNVEAIVRRLFHARALIIQKKAEELERLESVDFAQLQYSQMTLIEKVEQKAMGHNEYKLVSNVEDTVVLLICEFMIFVTVDPNTGRVLSLDIEDPSDNCQINNLIKWQRSFFHKTIDQQSILSSIGHGFSVLSLMDYLELQFVEFLPMFKAVLQSRLMYGATFDENYWLHYRYVTFRIEVEVILDLSQFNIGQEIVIVVHRGPSIDKNILEIINSTKKFTFECIENIDKYLSIVLSNIRRTKYIS